MSQFIQSPCVPGTVLGTEETDKQNKVSAFKVLPILGGKTDNTRGYK